MESGKQQPGLSVPKPRAPEKGLQPCLQAGWAPHHLSIQGVAACLFLTEKISCKFHPATDLLLSPSFTCPGLFCQVCQCIRVRGGLQAKRPSSYPWRLPEIGSLLCCEKSSSQNSQPSGTSQGKAWGLACPTEALGVLSLSLWARRPSWGLARPRSRQAHASLSQSCISRPISGSFGFGSFSMSAKIRALWNLILWQEASLWWLCGMRWNLARLLEELNPWSGNIMRTQGHSPFRVESRALIVGPRLRLAGSRLGAGSLSYHKEDLGGSCRDSKGLTKLWPQILNCSLSVELKHVRAINQHEKQMY